MERLNYFNPYQSKGAWHEDQLTRAFLVVVRMVPLALSTFLDLIRDRQVTAKSERPLPSLSDLMIQGVANWGTHYFELKSARTRVEAPVKRCALCPNQTGHDLSIELAMYPGDTMTQARSFYRHLAEYGLTTFLNLENQGWTVKTNFHFGFIQKGFGHGVRTTLSVEDYLRYWVSNAGSIGQFSGDEHGFESSFKRFVVDGLISETDVQWLSAKAAALGATNVNIIPGLEVIHRWSLADAVAIDKNSDGMIEEVRRKTNEAIATWGGALVAGNNF